MSTPFWRTEDPEFFVEGEEKEAAAVGKFVGQIKKGGMFAHQRLMWYSKKFFKALIGGYGAGKTSYCAKRCIAVALHNAVNAVTEVPVMVISPNFKQAKKTIIPAIKDLLEGRQLDYTYNKSDFEFTIWRGGKKSIIWIGSGENPDSLKGPNLAAAYIDEPFIQDEQVFIQMQARVRHPMARYKEICLFGTPEQLNWGYEVCEGDKKEQYDFEIIKAGTDANKALDEKTIETMFAGYDEKLKKAFRDGEFINLSKGAIYYAFDRNLHVVKITPEEDEEVFIGMDFNVNPMSFVAFLRREDKLFFFKEFKLRNSDTFEACDVINEHFGDNCNVIFPDPACNHRRTNSKAGQTDKSIIMKSGFRAICRAKHPSHRDRFNSVNAKFANMEMFIDPSCTSLIKSLEQLTFEQLSKQEELTHMVDALGYPVERIFPVGQALKYQREKWI